MSAFTAVKVTVSVALPPAGTLMGAAGDQLNSVTVPAQRAIDETVRAAVPLFWIDVVREEAEPTFTDPKASAGGASAMTGLAAATTVNELVCTRSSPWPALAEATKLGPKKAPPASNWLPYQATHQV